MKHTLTKSRVICYLLLLAAASLLILSITRAGFKTKAEANAVAEAAAWGSEVNTIDINIDGLEPGGTKEYKFSVTNKKGAAVSEAAQNYSITVETTENLPLQYKISQDSGDSSTGGAQIQDGDLTLAGGKVILEGGSLPHSDETKHTYILTVHWPSDQNEVKYADEIDMVTITVNSRQTQLTR